LLEAGTLTEAHTASIDCPEANDRIGTRSTQSSPDRTIEQRTVPGKLVDGIAPPVRIRSQGMVSLRPEQRATSFERSSR